MMLVAVPDPEAEKRHTARGDKRVEKYALNAAKLNGVVHFKISLRKYRQMGRKGGANSRKGMSWKTKRGLARKAANARWDKVRAKRIALECRALQPIEMNTAQPE